MASGGARRLATVLGESKVSACLFAVAIACICAKYLLLGTHPGSARTLFHVGSACGAVVVVMGVTARLDRCSDLTRLVGYAAGLLAVFGYAPFTLAKVWLSQPDCEAAGAGVTGPNSDLPIRVIEAVIAAALLAGIALWPRSSARSDGSAVPSRWSVLVLGGLGACGARILSTLFAYCVTLTPRCIGTTAAALPIATFIPAMLISGFQEELALTGIAIAFVSGARPRAMVAAVVLNVGVRGAGHLYYADHRTTLLWLAWVVIWSGGSLAFGFWLGRRACAQGMSVATFAMVFAVATAIGHSSLNFGPLVLCAYLLLLVLAALVAKPGSVWSGFRWVSRTPEPASED
jgi:hypothetical protein